MDLTKESASDEVLATRRSAAKKFMEIEQCISRFMSPEDKQKAHQIINSASDEERKVMLSYFVINQGVKRL